MALSTGYRALSLDLWFTTLYYGQGRDDEWTADRVRLLQRGLRPRVGTALSDSAIETAMHTVHSRLRSAGRSTITVDPEALIPQYAATLDAELTTPLSEFARQYSAVGLVEHPPTPNPEAISVVRSLTDRRIPVIATTNTARRGSSWHDFLRDHADLGFSHVVSSVDCGSAKPDPLIFRAAAEHLGLEPHEILHVGDRWELDVEGAQAAGFGAALYSGLWNRYPEGLYPTTDVGRADGRSVLHLVSLEELTRRSLLRGPSE